MKTIFVRSGDQSGSASNSVAAGKPGRRSGTRIHGVDVALPGSGAGEDDRLIGRVRHAVAIGVDVLRGLERDLGGELLRHERRRRAVHPVAEVHRHTEVVLEGRPVVVPGENLERARGAARKRLAVRSGLDPVDVRLDGTVEGAVVVPVDRSVGGGDECGAVEAEDDVPRRSPDSEALVQERLEERRELLSRVVERRSGSM